jgi:hypothetical protein
MEHLSHDTQWPGRDSNRPSEDNEFRPLPLRQPAPFVCAIRTTRKADHVCGDTGPCLNLTGLSVVQNSFIKFQGGSFRWAAAANVGLCLLTNEWSSSFVA